MSTCMQIILQMAANTKNMQSSQTFLLRLSENYHIGLKKNTIIIMAVF